VDDPDEWTPLDELAAFFEASSPEEFHRMLIQSPILPGKTSDTFLPWCLFHHFHEGHPDGSVITAMLLVTDRRWRAATDRLIRRIDESGLVPSHDLGVLARAFLAARSHVFWQASADWFDGPEIVIDDPPDESEQTDDSLAADNDGGGGRGPRDSATAVPVGSRAVSLG
jgi:hypothetical protein